ncbi:MAG TPA: radical SAM protein [Candidatus Saccharimonadales bacterium]|nr:radical SAM protein [Candidatus Saccharimonadales bacterium]
MLTALHTDRTGRIVVAADYGAAAQAGGPARAFAEGIPLPPRARVVPLPDRDALGMDRHGRPRSLGAGRWAVGAILGPGHLRTQLPACTGRDDAAPLEPQGYAAVAAGADGALIVAAVPTGEGPAPVAPTEVALAAAITAGLRAHPSSAALRQLARRAREHEDAGTSALFLHQGDGPLPVSGDRITAADLADLAIAHLAAGGTGVTFGLAGDPDPLTRPRVVADAASRIREAIPSARIAVRTNAAAAAAIARVAEAGVDRLVIPLASARPETYERLHPARVSRWPDVRSGFRQAVACGLPVTIELLVLPGLTDRAEEADALVALLRELPSGSAVRLRDLVADPYVLLRANPGSEPLGIEVLLARLRTEASAVSAA